MRYYKRMGAMGLLACLVVGAAACGGSTAKATGGANPGLDADAPPTSPSPIPSPSPAVSQSPSFPLVELPAPPALPKAFASLHEMPLNIGLSGKWRTSSFQPAFSFTAPRLAYPFTAGVDAPDFAILSSGDPDALAFVRPSGVFDQGTVATGLPKNMVSWLRGSPHLQSGATSDVVVGGIQGTQFDAVVTSVPSEQPSECVSEGIQCLPIAFDSDGVELQLKGEKVRFIVLDVGEGPPLLITIEAYPNDFASFSGYAERLIDSIAFATTAG